MVFEDFGLVMTFKCIMLEIVTSFQQHSKYNCIELKYRIQMIFNVIIIHITNRDLDYTTYNC